MTPWRVAIIALILWTALLGFLVVRLTQDAVTFESVEVAVFGIFGFAVIWLTGFAVIAILGELANRASQRRR